VGILVSYLALASYFMHKGYDIITPFGTGFMLSSIGYTRIHLWQTQKMKSALVEENLTSEYPRFSIKVEK
jgi:hypothetical protein